GENVRYAGILEDFKISRVEAEQMVMAARIKAGWVTEEELAAAEAEAVEEMEEVVEEENKKQGRIF
ncbi:MAG: hypothetical protein AAGA76_10840, partial [Pseudomonadota bacterium]